MDKKSLRADDLEVIEKYSHMVYRMAFSLLKNRYDAEDVHQDVFVQYLKKRPKFENSQHERAWFLRVTVNLCKNFWKVAWRQREVSLVEEELDSQPAAGAENAEDNIIGLVKKLPRKYRIVIHLFYYEELSTEDIAKVLSMKPSAVRTQLTRARAKLKELL